MAKPRKGQFGKIAGFDSLGKIRQSKSASPRVPPPTHPVFDSNPCTQEAGRIVNTSIDHPGRQNAESIVYDASQSYNYQRQITRYSKAIANPPTQFLEKGENGNPEWLFCSSRAPESFWHVRIVEACTRVKVGDPIYLLCPPVGGYKLSQVQTDCTALNWRQLTGRTIALDPPTAPQPDLYILDDLRALVPIVLRASLPNKPDQYDDLYIWTTPTSTSSGAGLSGSVESLGIPSQELPCTVQIAPSRPYSVYQWLSGTVRVAWGLPQDPTNLLQTRWQKNVGGVYVDETVIPARADRVAIAAFDEWYRLVADYSVGGSVYSVISPTCRFHSGSDPISQIIALSRFFGDDRSTGAGLSGGGQLCITYNLQPIALTLQDISTGAGLSGGGMQSIELPLLAQTLSLDKERCTGAGLSGGGATCTTYNFSGIIIG